MSFFFPFFFLGYCRIRVTKSRLIISNSPDFFSITIPPSSISFIPPDWYLGDFISCLEISHCFLAVHRYIDSPDNAYHKRRQKSYIEQKRTDRKHNRQNCANFRAQIKQRKELKALKILLPKAKNTEISTFATNIHTGQIFSRSSAARKLSHINTVIWPMKKNVP